MSERGRREFRVARLQLSRLERLPQHVGREAVLQPQEPALKRAVQGSMLSMRFASPQYVAIRWSAAAFDVGLYHRPT